ncbi:protein kinase subdomain-containing protein pkl ccin3 [Moniliophthora roreri MCA 2997]|uniref:Protein kinase subdomain-containing protein pkl ccin3 n=2 Tax=Moniliophthora roreri TaxID=221103 RepID=V2WT34_MONRO|nr:protein kinase subdomain-containing protein pkl ccin3 [Moniliophthora roreri MCA 2997]
MSTMMYGDRNSIRPGTLEIPRTITLRSLSSYHKSWGERCAEHWEIWQKPKDGLKEDIIAVLEDIGAYGVIHTDVTAFNILRFTGDGVTGAHCPRHNVIHSWRIIDFDRSWKIDMDQLVIIQSVYFRVIYAT